MLFLFDATAGFYLIDMLFDAIHEKSESNLINAREDSTI